MFVVRQSPMVKAAVAVEADFTRGDTPERVEFENSVAVEADHEADELSEIDEDEFTDHNFGNSIVSSSDDASSFEDSRYNNKKRFLSLYFIG